MKIGVPKEIKDQEGRVGITPAGVATLIAQGHEVSIETDAGIYAGFSNEQYSHAGAHLVSASQAWDSELVVKVKEPLPSEYGFLAKQMVFTFFHLAGVDPDLTTTLLSNSTTAIAYETLTDSQGRLPLLAPMSAIAGNMSALVGNYYLAKFNGGKGVQLGNVLGKRHGKVVVVGDGIVGQHAAKTASGMGANVFIAGIDTQHMASLKANSLADAEFFLSTPENLSEHLQEADLLIGAVLARGAHAPKLIDEAMIASMQPGSVAVDVSIDQGGCFSTSKPTSHSAPVFIKHGVIHYCVTNMPGAYPRTATLALMDATLPYIVKIANAGKSGLLQDAELLSAINTFDGRLTLKPVAEALNRLADYQPFE